MSKQKEESAARVEDNDDETRSLKRAVIIFAVLEFVVLLAVVYFKSRR
ncbi:MAG TPA: hypothetical protein VGB73_06450 [Pyrinomonadaceae bacterium]|jgi:hypothetical protein